MNYVVCSVCRKAHRSDLATGWLRLDDATELIDFCSWECLISHAERQKRHEIIPHLPVGGRLASDNKDDQP